MLLSNKAVFLWSLALLNGRISVDASKFGKKVSTFEHNEPALGDIDLPQSSVGAAPPKFGGVSKFSKTVAEVTHEVEEKGVEGVVDLRVLDDPNASKEDRLRASILATLGARGMTPSLLKPIQNHHACYAERYDLLDRFCGGEKEKCRSESLSNYYHKWGKPKGHVWGCNPEAVCYAQRYPDLYAGFCLMDDTKCKLDEIEEHYENNGKDAGLVWGCISDADAICYADRHPDLKVGFCSIENEEGETITATEHCNIVGLYDHYIQFGEKDGLFWGCGNPHRHLIEAYALPSEHLQSALYKKSFTKEPTTKVRACLGPLYNNINWNAVAGWIEYHEKRWGLTHVDVYIQGSEELSVYKEAFDAVGRAEPRSMNFTLLPTKDPSSGNDIAFENDPAVAQGYQKWIMNECLANAKEYNDDYLINFDADEYLISEDYKHLDDMFKFADKDGIAFPKYMNNYHRCETGIPVYGSAVFQGLVPYGAEKIQKNNNNGRKQRTLSYSDPPFGTSGQRKYVVIPSKFDALLGINDPAGDGWEFTDYNETSMFYMTGRKEDMEHARLMHYQTYTGIHADATDLPCHVIKESVECKYLNEDGECVDDISLADYENKHTSVNKLLSDLSFNRISGDLYPQAVCYAERYKDLGGGYCKGNNTLCQFMGLHNHYQEDGKNTHLIWGCQDRNTTPAKGVWAHLPKRDQDRILKAEEEEPLNLHILIFETDPDKAKLMVVLDQAEYIGIPITVFGTGSTFNGFGTKWNVVGPVLEALPKNTIVAIVDGRDVLLNIHAKDVKTRGKSGRHHPQIEQFINSYRSLTLDKPGAIIMSGEAQCCVSALTFVSPGDYYHPVTGKRTSRACPSGKEGCIWAGDTFRVPWENFMEDLAESITGDVVKDVYLNAGLVAGKSGDLLNLIELVDMDEPEDDQAVFTGFMYHYPDLLVLDYAQEVFGNNRWPDGMDGGGCIFDPVIDEETGELGVGSIIHRETGTTPLFLHTPGKFFDCFYHMGDLLELGIAPEPKKEKKPEPKAEDEEKKDEKIDEVEEKKSESVTEEKKPEETKKTKSMRGKADKKDADVDVKTARKLNEKNNNKPNAKNMKQAMAAKK